MKKFLKFIAFTFFGFVGLLILAMVCIPLFFKDEIKQAVDKTIAQYINAGVNYEPGSFSLSLFSDFPDAQVGIKQLSIVNKGAFLGDTLVSLKEAKLSLDIKSLFTEEFQINSIYLKEPRVFAQVNNQGEASWDITFPDSLAPDTTSSSFALNIDRWEIENGKVKYNDRKNDVLAEVKNLNHSGSGKIADIIKLSTLTTGKDVYLNYAGITYLDQVKLDAKTDLDIDGDKYTFQENSLKLNDLSIKFNGFTEILEEEIKLDLSLDADESNFKQLLSLIPSVFLNGYENIEANGDFKLDAKAKGVITEQKTPTFDVNLVVKNGTFKYPDLPKQVKDINLDLNVKNVTDNIDATVFNAKQLDVKMGNSALSGRILVAGLYDYYLDTDFKANLDVNALKEYYPLDGNEVKGKLFLEAIGKGKLDLDNNSFPAVNGRVNLVDGSFKTESFSLPVEKVNFISTFNSDGTTQGTTISSKNISMLLDGKEFGGELEISNLDKVNYTADLNGAIDLGKLFKVFPLDGMTISKGFLNVNSFNTVGSMQALENEDYASLKTSGSATLTDFLYTDEEYVKEGLAVTKTNVSFTPDKINIDSFNGFLGKSDLSISGFVSNYMGYLFSNVDTTLGGTMLLSSKSFNINPILEDPTGESTDNAPVATQVTPIPRNIHFFFDSKIGEFIYDDLTLNNFDGDLEIRDGAVNLNNVAFKALGADFKTSGFYDTKNPRSPKYALDLKIGEMPISEAYKYFNVVKALAPLGNKIVGSFNTDISMSGNLNPDYLPDLNTLSLSGILDIIKATAKVTDVKALQGITEFTKLASVKEFVLENEQMDIQVKNGKLWVKPFLMKGNKANLTTQVNTGIVDNTISHHMLLDVPSNLVKASLSKFGLNESLVGDRIDFNFDVLGTRSNPEVKFKKASAVAVKEAIKENAKEKVADAKEEFEKNVEAELEKKKKEAEEKAKAEADKAKKEAEARAKAEAEKIKAEAEKKAKEARDKAKENVKDKLGIPW